MKYLKLFESFDSKAISQIIKYLNPESSKIFIDILKKLVRDHDLPIDKINDDYLKYSRISKIDDDILSENDSESDIESVFFLFDHNKKIIGSFTDGSSLNSNYLWYVRNNKNLLNNIDNDFSKGNIKPINKSINYKRQLKSGDLVFGFLCSGFSYDKFSKKTQDKFGLSMVYEDDGSIYLIQNFSRGRLPDSTNQDYFKFGSLSWKICDEDGNIWDNYLLSKYTPSDDPISMDSFTGFGDDIGDYTPNVLFGSTDLNKSSFYIKFDFNRFKNDFGTITSKLQKRSEYKSKEQTTSLKDRLSDFLIKKSEIEKKS